MKHIASLIILIDAAKAITGSHAATARALGVPPEHVSGWRSGDRTATPEDQALLAGLAGFDPVQTLARATVEKWEGKPKGDRLMKVLGKLSQATGAASVSGGLGALLIFSKISDWAMQCILC